MAKLISSALGLIFSFVADHFLAKWVGHIRLWWFKYDNNKLKAEADAKFLDLQQQSASLRDKRHELRDRKPERK